MTMEQIEAKVREQQEKIKLWNMERNQLKLDIGLERRLLSEEHREFALAETLEDKVREYADYLFVFGGFMHMMLNLQDQMKTLEQWAITLGELMEDELHRATEELGVSRDQYNEMILKVVDLVIAANEAKGLPGPDGKVPKGPLYRDPIEAIRAAVYSAIPPATREGGQLMCFGMGCRYEHSYTGECSFGGEKYPPDAACMENEVLPVVNCEKCPYEVTGGDCQGECIKEIKE